MLFRSDSRRTPRSSFGLRMPSCSSNQSLIIGRSPTLSTSACVPTTATPMFFATIRRRTNGDWSPFVPQSRKSSLQTPRLSPSRTDGLFSITMSTIQIAGDEGMHDYGVLLANEEGKWVLSQLNDEGKEILCNESFSGPLQALRILSQL